MLKNIRQLYLTVVPHWLADAVMAHPEYANPEIFADYEKLSSIVSASDVCFYHILQSELVKNLEGFSDMDPICMKPVNLNWLKVHANVLDTAEANFKIKVAGGEETDLLMCGNYKPEAVTEDTLALVSSRGEVNPLNFEKDCLEALSKQMTFEEYKLYDIYRLFTRV